MYVYQIESRRDYWIEWQDQPDRPQDVNCQPTLVECQLALSNELHLLSLGYEYESQRALGLEPRRATGGRWVWRDGQPEPGTEV